ncbi:glycosyl hydrolase family 18 protein [Aneurinibacillus sp. Ricciae_BoGa-3]|uniref:glycosyl hydrolase family 18 protein n=1 Tax=Aneurinibacillus sp. Ricciae_BoGa-3 TaxID=3022697 RepID=UPI00233FB87C|nr:glycosyl hydrolase family 18 protein [Aneurinibacillus sp. Ricciae_BoGa-3]WCK54916.1 glycosyl hydrolase family 18 protein [Aneurinibacillus sp. Ricciae_BoGa-3]
MFIYTVKPGDSLFSISAKYGTTVDSLRAVNGLLTGEVVPGLALVINLSVYTVQPGDSLYSISQMTFVPVNVLIAANPTLNVNSLQPGMKVVIPRYPDYKVTTLGFTVLQTPELDRALIRDFAPYSTYIGIFEYHIGYDGSLSELNDQPAIDTAKGVRVAPLATITNLTATGFDRDVVTTVLRSPGLRQTLIDNIFNIVTSKGYAGVCIDFEQVAPYDRDYYSDFLRQLRDRFRPAGLVLTVAVPAKTGEDVPWLQGYDFGAIGSVVDLMFLMAYDFHEQSSEPGPVAPINDVRQTVQFALNNVSRDKLLLGVPLYGYDWPIPYSPDNPGRAIAVQDIVNLAIRYGVPIQYSQEYQSPYFQYVDESGQNHIVWFEDPRSMGIKMQLVYQYRLRGLGAWQLNLSLPQGPYLLVQFFTIRKVL